MHPFRTEGLFREVLLLASLAFAVHALALRFVFPGYYDPLWPHHADFYVPAALAQSAAGVLDLVRQPRPAGMMFLEATGHLGIQGAIAATLALTFANCAGTAALVRRLVGDDWSPWFVLAYAIYVFLVFSHPYFYVIYSHDVLSQLSYALLLATAWFLIRFDATQRMRDLVVAGAFALLAFLSKETYGLPALFLAAAHGAVSWTRGSGRAAILSLLTLAAMLAVALLVSAANGSMYTGAADYPGSPYQVVLAPRALAAEWLQYAKEALNPISAAVIVMVALTVGTLSAPGSARSRLAWLLPVAAALAWVGNATLPNHHYPGYSWNGAYLMYAPLLTLAPFAAAGRRASAASAAALLLALASPVLDQSARERNQWTLVQEARQRNLLHAVRRLAGELPPRSADASILVTGINFPFSPFDHGQALRSYPGLRGARFDVVTYRPAQAREAALPALTPPAPDVRFVPRSEVDLSRYVQAWAFRPDGTLVAATAIPATGAAPGTGSDLFTAADLLMFPGLSDLFGSAGGSAADGTKYIACGSLLISYDALDEAEACLGRAIERAGANPYSHFYLGMIRERKGDIDAARRDFERAMALDDATSPNPHFRAAVSRTTARSRERK